MTALMAVLALVLHAQAPLKTSPQKVIDEYLRAAGGAKVLAKLQTQIIAGNLTEESTGKTGSYSLITKTPNHFYLETIVESDHEITAYNGMSAWGQNSADGTRTFTGAASSEAEASGRYWNGRLTDLKGEKLTVRLVGVENVHGKEAYRVAITLAPRIHRDLYFDTATHLILREADSSGTQFDYEDYRPVNGVQTPFRIELRRGGKDFKIAVTRAEFNSPVDDSAFAFPRAKGAPLPDVHDLLLQVNQNQKALEEIQKLYTCHAVSESDEADPDGHTKSTKEFDVYNVAGEEVRRHTATDGKPLSDKDRKKEDERFSKEFEKLTKKQAELAADPKKQQKQQDKDDSDLSSFLRAWRFSNPRWERFRGYDVIAVDFGPDPNHKAQGMAENFAQKLSGVMWIDAQALDVVRAEARFVDSMKIAGGVLASLDKGSNLVWEQARINDEVWLPVYTEIHISGRFLLFKAKANQIERYSDYKKFQADSKLVVPPE